jgi:hypothetical protein
MQAAEPQSLSRIQQSPEAKPPEAGRPGEFPKCLFLPALWKSLNVRLPDRAQAIMASAICLRVSWVSLSGGIVLQTRSSAAVMFAMVV